MLTRALVALACAAALVAGVPNGVGAEGTPRCRGADVTMLSNVDSAFATAGDSFTFRLAERVAAGGGVPAIPAGTRGYGVVAFADHARGAGSPGRLVLEPRFLTLPDGSHLPVIADPQLSESFVAGQTRSVNGALGFVPGFGLAVSGYNALHRGREVTVAPGTTFRIVLGDALALGSCFVPPPSAPDVR